MTMLIPYLTTMATAVGGKIILALIVLIVGNILIKSVLKMLDKSKMMERAEGTIRTFTLSFVKIGLYVLLIISIISIMGVPMASVIAVLASAGVAVGLALQGALSNLSGGIMLMILKPFKLGDYVSASGVEGVVKELTLFYAVFMTVDNKKITVPNGSLMNANITNFSSEALRRVDLTFSCTKSEVPSKVQDVMITVMKANPQVLSDPAPFARLSGGSNEAMNFTVRAWCKSEDYWDVYFDLTQRITEAMAENDIKAPAIRITTDAAN